jgi:MOSC domain-containing protein YiiM
LATARGVRLCHDSAMPDPHAPEGIVVSLNVGMPIEVPFQNGIVSTGIFKTSVDDRRAMCHLGIEGDGQADLSVHGGVDKAVYVYSQDSYAWWIGELGHTLQPGEFGENLTVTGFTDDIVRIGDRLRVGTALTEVSQPREPCFKLGIRMGDKRFVARFRDAARTGFYLRVLEEGDVAAGDPVSRVHSDPGSPTVADIHDIFVNGRDDLDRLRWAADTHTLEHGWRSWMKKRIVEIDTSVT